MPELNMTRHEASRACMLAYAGLLRDGQSHVVYRTTSGQLNNCLSYMAVSDHVADVLHVKDAQLSNGSTYQHPMTVLEMDAVTEYYQNNLPVVDELGDTLTYKD